MHKCAYIEQGKRNSERRGYLVSSSVFARVRLRHLRNIVCECARSSSSRTDSPFSSSFRGFIREWKRERERDIRARNVARSYQQESVCMSLCNTRHAGESVCEMGRGVAVSTAPKRPPLTQWVRRVENRSRCERASWHLTQHRSLLCWEWWIPCSWPPSKGTFHFANSSTLQENIVHLKDPPPISFSYGRFFLLNFFSTQDAFFL